MTSIQNYREALQNSASAYSATLRPKRALMPLDFYEINLRSDAPATAVSTSLASLTRLLQSKSHWDMGVKAGRRMPIYVPGRGLTHITVQPQTRVSIDIKAKNSLPRAVIKFSHPVRIIRPSNDTGACVVNLLCDYHLDSVTIHPNHAVDLDGSLATGLPGVRRHWPKRVVEPSSGSQPPQKHSMIRLAVATAIAVMRKVPHAGVQAIAKNMASDAKRDDSGENLKMVESILPLLTPGMVRGESIVDASDKPLVVRCDRADVLIPAQKYQHHLNATVTPTRKNFTVTIGEGTQLAADSLRLDMSGSIFYDGRNLTGRDVQAQISQLSLIALINNGTPNQVLFPLYIDTTRAQNNSTVARVASNFSFGEKMRLGGSVSFCLPALIQDSDRSLETNLGTVALADARMQLVLQGNATMGNQGSDYHVNLRVRQLSARGEVHTKSAYADAAMPWSIEGCKKADSATASADPLNIDIHVQTQQPERGAASATVVRQAGATVRSALPLRLGVPGKLHIAGAQGALDVHSAAVHVASTVLMGSHVSEAQDTQTPRNKMEAHVDLRLLQFAGTVQTDALAFESFHLPKKALWRVGTGHVATEAWDAPLGLLHADIITPDATDAPWHCQGGASFHLPAQFDGCHDTAEACDAAAMGTPRQASAKVAQLAVEAAGGPLTVTDLGAEIACEDAKFDITSQKRHFHLPVITRYTARTAGVWQANFGLDTAKSPTWAVDPEPLVAPDSDSDESFETADEGEAEPPMLDAQENASGAGEAALPTLEASTEAPADVSAGAHVAPFAPQSPPMPDTQTREAASAQAAPPIPEVPPARDMGAPQTPGDAAHRPASEAR